MKQYSHTLSFFKILFAFVFTLLFSTKSIANTATKSTYSNSASFSALKLNDKDKGLIEEVNSASNEEEEEEVSIDFFSNFKVKASLTKTVINSNQCFNAHPLSIEKKRYYILYCQLKVHL